MATAACLLRSIPDPQLDLPAGAVQCDPCNLGQHTPSPVVSWDYPHPEELPNVDAFRLYWRYQTTDPDPQPWTVAMWGERWPIYECDPLILDRCELVWLGRWGHYGLDHPWPIQRQIDPTAGYLIDLMVTAWDDERVPEYRESGPSNIVPVCVPHLWDVELEPYPGDPCGGAP